MSIAETVEQIIKEAQLTPIEARCIVLRFGLRGETPNRLNDRVALFQADETIMVKKVTRDWVRNKEVRALEKMRGARERLKIDASEMRKEWKEEPYKGLCDVILGIGIYG